MFNGAIEKIQKLQKVVLIVNGDFSKFLIILSR